MYTVWHVDKYKITFKLVINHWSNEICSILQFPQANVCVWVFLRIFPLWNFYSWKLLRKLKWQIPEETLAAWYNWCQGPVSGRGPAVEKHCTVRYWYCVHFVTCNFTILLLNRGARLDTPIFFLPTWTCVALLLCVCFVLDTSLVRIVINNHWSL